MDLTIKLQLSNLILNSAYQTILKTNRTVETKQELQEHNNYVMAVNYDETTNKTATMD